MRSVDVDDGFAADILYLAYQDRLDIGIAEFLRMTSGWTLGYMKVDGLVAGVAARKDGELHIGVLPEWRGRWATREFIRNIIAWAAHSGEVKTGVMSGNEKGKRLVEGVGFVPVESTEKGTRYELSTHAI
jgi:GNAT superfamily N-acetyltransferase